MIFTEKIKKPVAMTMAAAVCTLLMASSASAMADTGAATVYKAADAASLKQHVTALSEDIGVRLMGTPNEYAAAEYIEGQLDSYGYDGQISEYQIKENKATTVATVKIGKKEYYGNYYFNGDMQTITDPVIADCTIDASTATGVEVFDSWNITEGSVAVVNNSLFSKLAEPDGEKASTGKYIVQAAEKAAEKGAKALVVYMTAA